MNGHLVYIEGKLFIQESNGNLTPFSFGNMGGGGGKKVINNIVQGNSLDIWTGLNQVNVNTNNGFTNPSYYTFFRDIGGNLVSSISDAEYTYKGGVPLKLSNFSVLASNQNGTPFSDPITLTIMINGIATSIQIVLPTNLPLSQLFTDSVNSVNINDGDTISIKMETSALMPDFFIAIYTTTITASTI